MKQKEIKIICNVTAVTGNIFKSRTNIADGHFPKYYGFIVFGILRYQSIFGVVKVSINSFYQRTINLIFNKTGVDKDWLLQETLLKVELKLLMVISQDITGSIFVNILDFINLVGIFHFRNTKAYGKFEFKFLMSSMFQQMSSKNFFRSYRLLQMNLTIVISQLLMFQKRKFSTLKISIVKVTELLLSKNDSLS